MSQSQNSRKAQNGREKDSRYRGTVFLPETSFAMRGNLPVREPEILKFWEEIDLDGRIKAQGAQRKETFFLHDGPPYANGRIHIGHALNKISKDVINRAQRMSGKEVRYLPGWDCHGLPIEWKVEERYHTRNWSQKKLPISALRGACREYAAEQVEIQKADFQRLGVQAEWANAYITMDFSNEARIAAEIGKFLLNGLLYRDLRPVMWSVAERTALAEAEVEYKEIDSTALFVAFPIRKDPTGGKLENVSALIWTTTPWTIPLNQALAYGPEIDYAVIEAVSRSEGSLVPERARLLVAEELLESVMAKLALTEVRILHRLKGAELAGATAAHPFSFRLYGPPVQLASINEESIGEYERARPFLAGDFVTAEAGTGLVHIAPAHGEDDFRLAQKAGIPIRMGVRDNGIYEDWVGFPSGAGGTHIFRNEDLVTHCLMWARNKAAEQGMAAGRIGSEKIRHSYPHSWRSGAPLIYRATPQWFVALDKPGFSGKTLRQKALAALENTRFIPEQSRNRLTSMVSQRPDWCISRQRIWGVPLPIFTEKSSGLPLRDPAVINRIVQAFAKEGADCWYDPGAKERFLGWKWDCDPMMYDQASDIVDVWFESGSSHEFLPREKGLEFPADLYLEGSDQHRGWFQSSLLEGLGAEGKSPFRALLTQGFVLDGKGRKMSKSLGNVIAPESVSQKYGADILRLWAANTDASGDVRVDDGILRQQGEIYRRLRNTLRWMLGALKGWNPAHAVPYAELPEPEKYILHGLTGLWEKISGALETHDWNGVYPAVHDFCNLDLSAFYFDIRKDAVYCETPDSPERRAVMTTLDLLAQALITWLAPVLAFTAEDAFQARLRDRGVEDGRDSVHLQEFFRPHAQWRDSDLGARWEKIRRVRRGITTALENARNEGVIRSSLEAQVVLPLTEEEKALAPDASDAHFWEALAIVSRVHLADARDGAEVEVARASGGKCARCWKVLEEVGKDAEHPELCGRCAEAVMKLERAAAS